MKPIGGFFELEVASKKGGSYHPEALALNSGRAALNLIFQELKPGKVYIPFYTCDTLLEPFIVNKIEFQFYSIDENLEPDQDFEMEPDAYFLYINYFGLKTSKVKQLTNRFSGRVIVDNTQAFFEKRNGTAWSFNSARKFFGVPDGAYLYSPMLLHPVLPENDNIRYDHLINRLLGKQQQAYEEFVGSEKGVETTVKKMSELSKRLLSNVDYNLVREKRRQNFLTYAEALNRYNKLDCSLIGNETPFCYPLLLASEPDRQFLFNKEIYIPYLWKDVEFREGNFNFEKQFARRLLPLPVDHRYDKGDCQKVINAVSNLPYIR